MTQTITTPAGGKTAESGPPPIAWRPLGIAAGLTAAVLIAFAGRYGYHRDELYYLEAGRHLAWGYDDQPPLTPAIARLTDVLSGGSLIALRVPTALVVGLTVLLVGLLARELGGGRGAQLLAAICWAVTPMVIISGHLLSTTPYDVLCWTALAYLLARWIRTRDDRLLLAIGVVFGVGMLAKNLPVLYAVGLLGGALIVGPRDLLRRPALWIAALIGLVIWSPNLWWQATHDWPQLTMTQVVRDDADFGGRLGLLPSQLLVMGPPLAVLWIAGLVWLLRRTGGRYRLFGWAYVIVLVLVLATGGREYYPGGAYPALYAAGSVAVLGWLGQRAGRAAGAAEAAVEAKPGGPRWRGWAWVGVALLLINTVATVIIALPVFPAAVMPDTPQGAINYDSGETIGWQELTATVAGVYRSLPADEQRTAIILASNYGEAGALDKYGDRYGLPKPYSGHLNYWRWGPPPDSATGPVILVGGYTAQDAEGYCQSFTADVARNDNGYDVDNEEQGARISLCRGLKMPWSQIWPSLHRFA